MGFIRKIFVLGGLSIAGVSIYFWRQFTALKKNISDTFLTKPQLVVTEISLQKVSIRATYMITNPTILSAIVPGYEIDVYLNGDLVAHISNTSPVSINSKSVNGGVTELPLLIDVVPNNLVDKGLKYIGLLVDKSQWNNLVFNLVGSFQFVSSPLTGTIPLNISFSLADVTK